MPNVIDKQEFVGCLRSPVCSIIRSILSDIGCVYEEDNNKFYIEYDYIFDCAMTVFDGDGSLSLLTQLCLIDPDNEREMLERALRYNLDYGKTRGASIFASADNSVFLFKTRFPALKMDYSEVSSVIARFLVCAERLGLLLTGQEAIISSLGSRVPKFSMRLPQEDFAIVGP